MGTEAPYLRRAGLKALARGSRFCTWCKQTKAVSEFTVVYGVPGQYCRVCSRVRGREQQARNREKHRLAEPDRSGTKRCWRCREVKAKTEFSMCRCNRDGLTNGCRRCQVEEHRKTRLRKRFGITESEYATKHEAQHGLCAICGKPEWRKQRGVVQRLAVDHDHTTGGNRDLLCSKCNLRVGHTELILYGNDAWQRKVEDYLRRRWKGEPRMAGA